MFGDRFFTRSLFISLMMTGFLASAHAADPCQPMFDGEAAMVYTMHSETEDSKDDAQMWISRATGFPLREEMDVDVGGAADKDHFSARFEYSNIHPPL